MKIVVNTRLLIKDKLESIGSFTYETLKTMTKQHPEHQFVLLFDHAPPKEFRFPNNVRCVELYPPARSPLLWWLWFEIAVPYIIKKEKADLYLSPDGYASLRAAVPTVLVVHDLAFRHFPQSIARQRLMYYNYFMPRYLQKANRIAAISTHTKQDIIHQYQVPSEKIDVVYNSYNENYKPIPEREKTKVKQLCTQGKDYFLTVGTLQRRKNSVALLLAFDAFKAMSGSDVKLLVVGEEGRYAHEVHEAHRQLKHKDDVIFAGRVSNIELNRMYGAALALVHIPLLEGFGVSVLEAQRCECPVITSGVSAMPEVAGKGALFVDPSSVTSVAEGMLKLYKDPKLRHSLVTKGHSNYLRFSWQQTSDALWQTMMQAL